MEGIISAFKIPTAEREVSCTLLFGKGSESAKLKTEPRLYEAVGHEGTIEEGKEAYTKLMKSLVSRAALRRRAKAVLAECRKEYGKPASPMLNDLAATAEEIMRAFISGAPMIVRFDGDGDGVAGGLAIYRALNGIVASGLSSERQVSWQVNKDVVYTKEAFYSDRLLFSSFKSAEKPLLVIIDFGTHVDSNDAAALAEKVCNVVWIDHHTIHKDFNPGKSRYINPFNYGSDSRLSAGFMASLVGQIIGADCADLMEAALISDHSACADYKNAQARKAALVMDYMVGRRESDSSSLRKIDSAIRDRTKLEELYTKVGGMLDEAIGIGAKVASSYKTANGVDVYVIDFRRVREGGYPPMGRFASEMHYHLETLTGKPAITAVYYGNYISVRISKAIAEEVGLIGIIDQMREESAGAITGGGHREAASVRGASHEITKVLAILLDKLKVMG